MAFWRNCDGKFIADSEGRLLDCPNNPCEGPTGCALVMEDWESGSISDDWEIVSGSPTIVDVSGSKYLRMGDDNSLLVWTPSNAPGGAPFMVRIHVKDVQLGLRIVFNYQDSDNYHYISFTRAAGLDPSQDSTMAIYQREGGTDTRLVVAAFRDYASGLHIYLGDLGDGFTGVRVNHFTLVDGTPTGISSLTAAKVPFSNTTIGIGTGAIGHYSPAQVDVNSVELEYHFSDGEDCIVVPKGCTLYGGGATNQACPDAYEFVSGNWNWSGTSWSTDGAGGFVVVNTIHEELSDQCSIFLRLTTSADTIFGYQDPDNYYFLRYTGGGIFNQKVTLYQVEGGTETSIHEIPYNPGSNGSYFCTQGNRIVFLTTILAMEVPKGRFGLRAIGVNLPFGMPEVHVHRQIVKSNGNKAGVDDVCGCSEPCPVCEVDTSPRQLQIDATRTTGSGTINTSHLCEFIGDVPQGVVPVEYQTDDYKVGCLFRGPGYTANNAWDVRLYPKGIGITVPGGLGDAHVHPMPDAPFDGTSIDESFSFSTATASFDVRVRSIP